MVFETIGLREMVYYDSSCCFLQVQPHPHPTYFSRVCSLEVAKTCFLGPVLCGKDLYFWKGELPLFLVHNNTYCACTNSYNASSWPLNISSDWLTCSGTTQGDVFILNSASKQVQTVVRKAHLGFVTALSFSHDSRL